MWVEKEGAYGNAERRTHVWRQLVNAPGEARSDLWQMMEFSKRFTTDEVWPAEILAANPELSRQDPVRRSVPQRQRRQISGQRNPRRVRKPRIEGIRLLRAEGPVRGIRRIRPRPWPRSRILRHAITQNRGLRWPVVDGKETKWRYREGLRSLREAGQGRRLLRPAGRAGADHRGALRTARGIPRQGIRHLAGDRPCARTLALGIHDHAGARTLQGLPRRARLHACRRRARPGHQSGSGGPRGFPPRRNQDAASTPRVATGCRAAWSSFRGSMPANSSTR